jgi:hypothetical protein
MGTYDKNGEKYEGEWVNGQRDGYGTYYNRKGGRYEGCWRNGKRGTPQRFFFLRKHLHH